MHTNHPIDNELLELIDEVLRLAKVHAKLLMETRPESSRQVIDDSNLILVKLKTSRLQFVANCINREHLAAIFEDMPISPEFPEFTEELKKKYCKMLRNLSDDDMANLALLIRYHIHGSLEIYGQCVSLEIRRFFRKYVEEKAKGS